MWTPAWAALIGDPSGRRPDQLNLVCAVFTDGPRTRVVAGTSRDGRWLRDALVADLRSALVDYLREARARWVGTSGHARPSSIHRSVT